MSEEYAEITVQQVNDVLDDYHVVDVREPDEFTGELGHIAGSRLLPLGELMARVDGGEDHSTLFGDAGARPILMVCRSGGRSGMACARLAEAGVANATNMIGGMLEWNRVGLAVAGADPNAARQD